MGVMARAKKSRPKWTPVMSPVPSSIPSPDPDVIELKAHYNFHPVEVTLDGVWHGEASVVEHGGRLVVSRLEVKLAPDAELPPNGLGSSDLRKIRLPDAIAAGRYRGVELVRSLGYGKFSPETRRRLREGPRRAAGKWARGDDFYAQIALDYLKACQRAPRRANAHLSEMYLKKGFSEATPQRITNWVSEARRRYGFLTPPPARGLAGGEKTPKLEAWEKGRKR
jgi:hypothetical protein